MSLKKAYELIHHLSQTACGSLAGTAKIDFESYIQRQYFQKIIAKANQRLIQMTAGQFILKCRNLENLGNRGKVGLDLNVYSLVTESERDVKTFPEESLLWRHFLWRLSCRHHRRQRRCCTA